MSDIGCGDGRMLEVCETLAARGRMPGDRRLQTGATEFLSYWKGERASFRAHRTVPKFEEGGCSDPTHQWNFTGSCNHAKGGLRGAGVLPLRRLLAQFDPRRLLASPHLHTSPILVRGAGEVRRGCRFLAASRGHASLSQVDLPQFPPSHTALTVLAKLEYSSPRSHSTQSGQSVLKPGEYLTTRMLLDTYKHVHNPPPPLGAIGMKWAGRQAPNGEATSAMAGWLDLILFAAARCKETSFPPSRGGTMQTLLYPSLGVTSNRDRHHFRVPYASTLARPSA